LPITLDFRRVKRHGNKQIKRGQDDLSSEVNEAEKLAIIANKCMCDLLIRNPSFNFAKNLMASIVPRMCLQEPVEVNYHHSLHMITLASKIFYYYYLNNKPPTRSLTPAAKL
jgi:hypothetical protein